MVLEDLEGLIPRVASQKMGLQALTSGECIGELLRNLIFLQETLGTSCQFFAFLFFLRDSFRIRGKTPPFYFKPLPSFI